MRSSKNRQNASSQKANDKPRRSGWVMVGLVGLLYLATALQHPEILRPALHYAGYLLLTLLPIISVVFFLMGLLGSFIDPKAIARHLGEESGLRGWAITLLAGVLSHGPGYVWYPMLQEIRRHGARDSLVVAFFYSRSIKLPWLPLMVVYLGAGFTIFLTLYVLVASIIQGLIAEWLLRGDPTRQSSPSET